MKNWQFYVNRKFNYFIEWVQTICTQRDWQKESFGFSFPLKNYLILNGEEYYLSQGANNYKQFLERKYRKDKNFFDKFAKSEVKLARKSQEIEKFLKNKNPRLQKLSNEQLLLIYKKFLKNYIKCFATAFVRPDDYLEEKEKKELAKLQNKKISIKKIFNSIATYPAIGLNKLDYLEEPLQLLKITREIKDKGIHLKALPGSIKKKIKNHWLKYQWLKNPNGYPNLFLSEKEILERIKINLKEDIDKKINNILKTRKENELNYKKIVQIFDFSDNLKKLSSNLRQFIFLRTYTTEAADRLFYWVRQTILKETAKRMGLNNEDIVALTGDEIINFLTKGRKISPEIIKNRKKIFSVIWKKGRAKIYFGDSAKEVIRKYKNLRAPVVSKEKKEIIKGQVACPGKTQGEVKVLSSYLEVKKIKKGDILVVSMTTPDYVVAMEKASAFITDEGGITCHAAIISREMNKPCIIGTKIATKVLKDGDLVEVDAEKGVVRILKK